MRTLSENYTNGYIITIFACCRQLYDHREMSGGKRKKDANRMKKLVKLQSEYEPKFNNLKDEIRKLDGEESDTDKREKLQLEAKKSRGGNTADINLIKDPINLILIWGCRPTKGVLADTKMCNDLKQLFLDRFDRQTLRLEIPKVFDQLKATDA